ncbi:Dynein regulatory complex subunit 7 [Geodia barretti]|uniref:Dynein regulatory complex subunit 7 n=2 Tax=Geodia barretti TaxID=519541 RepID=A0AA35TI83_GEOBA|nr:Dynein regulatory complex subunit 7 [Geodia barretti]
MDSGRATPEEPQGGNVGEEAPPESYRSNSKKEELLLGYCDNFTRQFKKLYGDRKPQFLRPVNECGIEKFACTTLRPTCLPYKELYDWDGAASFVAGYITCSPLHPPDELPQQLSSPTLVLSRQEGTSFDMSGLLCSLLVGVGYDAYCVSGYAMREVTEVDQGGKTCPLLEVGEKEEEGGVGGKLSRYLVRPPRDLSSQFERRQETKASAEEERKKREIEAANAPVEEEGEVDKYHGLRVHCWVLVLSGKREVAQNFFIEATTGESYSTDSELYLGIESLWNHRNYWINMQDCARGLQNLVFDLGDATKWESFFPSVDQPLLVVPEESTATLGEEKKPDDKEDFELPPSWVLPLHISSKDFETRCPQGKKTTLYHKSRLETFSDYLTSDGLVSRLSLYSDTARRSRVETRSVYRHREDRLERRVEEGGSGLVHEEFSLGRESALRSHTHSTIHHHSRTLTFYHNARVDGLRSRELASSEMVEVFQGRPDFLHQRSTAYLKTTPSRSSGDHREVLRIVEKFHHDPSLPPNSAVAERVFSLKEPSSIRVTYHLEPDRITASHRLFLTPPHSQEQGYNLTFDPNAISGYQVDPQAPEPKSQELFQQLESLMAAQDDIISQVSSTPSTPSLPHSPTGESLREGGGGHSRQERSRGIQPTAVGVSLRRCQEPEGLPAERGGGREGEGGGEDPEGEGEGLPRPFPRETGGGRQGDGQGADGRGCRGVSEGQAAESGRQGQQTPVPV